LEIIEEQGVRKREQGVDGRGDKCWAQAGIDSRIGNGSVLGMSAWGSLWGFGT
jgi:hypothetical protein